MAKKPAPASTSNTPPVDPAAPGALDGAGAPGAPDAPGTAEQPPGATAAAENPPASTDAPTDIGKPISPNGLRITAAREGFRRAGRAWSKTPTNVPLADLSDDQVAMLRAEALLTVEDITIEAAAE